MTATPVRMDPRIRERRSEVQRELGRRRLRVMLACATVVVVVGLVFLVVSSPLLDVDMIRVAGAHHVADADVLSAAGVHVHDPLLLVDTAAVARRIERLAWVRHAVVRRDLLGTLRITITEYVPVAYVRVAAHSVVLIAADGHVVGRAAVAPRGTYEVRGVRALPPDATQLSPADAASVPTRLPAALARLVVAIDLRGPGISLDLASGGAVRLGTTDDLAAKAAAALAVLKDVGSQHFAFIDVSTPQYPVLRR